jgi:predicted Zn-dependent protease
MRLSSPSILSEDECRDLLRRLTGVTRGGGHTGVTIRSRWSGNVRWARNQISSAGEVHTNWIEVSRSVQGASAQMTINETTDGALLAAARRVERLVALERESRDTVDRIVPVEPMSTPSLFSAQTVALDAEQRAAVAHRVVQSAAAAGMLSAGYVEVSATSIAALDTLGRMRYFQYTASQYGVTVRDPSGAGSGWAGLDHYDWTKIDTATLSARALDKCLRSRNPVRIEPGRYVTILEPQAVCDFIGQMVFGFGALERLCNEQNCSTLGPFLADGGNLTKPGYARLGQRVVDERITISADPMDPDVGFPPFNTNYAGTDYFFTNGDVYHPTTWIDRGVLTNLAYDRNYGVNLLGTPTGLPNSGAFRMTGGTTSIDEMIRTTERGLLVTRFDDVFLLENRSQLYRGYTRDGLWLIEHGKISKPAKNLIFTESALFALNNVEQLGPPQRTYHPNPPVLPFLYVNQPRPVMVPALKVRDFAFTSLSDAV